MIDVQKSIRREEVPSVSQNRIQQYWYKLRSNSDNNHILDFNQAWDITFVLEMPKVGHDTIVVRVCILKTKLFLSTIPWRLLILFLSSSKLTYKNNGIQFIVIVSIGVTQLEQQFWNQCQFCWIERFTWCFCLTRCNNKILECLLWGFKIRYFWHTFMQITHSRLQALSLEKMYHFHHLLRCSNNYR